MDSAREVASALVVEIRGSLRVGCLALRAPMRGGVVDVVLAEALDRFSRDQEQAAAFYKLAANHRVRLVTLSEGEVGV